MQKLKGSKKGVIKLMALVTALALALTLALVGCSVSVVEEVEVEEEVEEEVILLPQLLVVPAIAETGAKIKVLGAGLIPGEVVFLRIRLSGISTIEQDTLFLQYAPDPVNAYGGVVIAFKARKFHPGVYTAELVSGDEVIAIAAIQITEGG